MDEDELLRDAFESIADDMMDKYGIDVNSSDDTWDFDEELEL